MVGHSTPFYTGLPSFVPSYSGSDFKGTNPRKTAKSYLLSDWVYGFFRALSFSNNAAY